MHINHINQGPHLLILQDEVCFKSIQIYLFFCTKCLQPAYLWPAVQPAVVLILANFLSVLDHKSKLDGLTYSLQWDWIQLTCNSCMRLTDYIHTIHVGGNSSSERLVCSNNRHRELNAWSACNREINRRDKNKSIDSLKRRLSAVKCTLFSKRCSQTLITSKIALSVLLSSFYNLPLSLFHWKWVINHKRNVWDISLMHICLIYM